MADFNVPSDPPYEAMASPTEATDGELSEVPSTIHYPPSERSGSDYGRNLAVVQADPPVPMILTRGFNPNAPRESSSADPDARGSGSQRTFMQKTDNHFNQLNIANTVLVAGQDPAMTSLIEATAELRHGEHVAEIKSEAERIHGDRLQAVRIQAEQEHKKKVNEVVGILQERMHAEEARMWERAEVMEKTTQRRLRDQSEEYRTVLDNHLRQVTASKDQQMEHMKREYSRQVAKEDVKISELEGLVRMQSEQIAQQQRIAEDLNTKMNQLLMGTSIPPLETGTMTMPCATKTHSTLSPDAKTFHPQVLNSDFQVGGEAEPWTLNTSGFPIWVLQQQQPSHSHRI